MKIHPYYQTLFVVWLNQIFFYITLYMLFSWYAVILAIISMYLFGMMSETGMHRYFAHKSYTTTKLKEKVLLFFATMAGQGATLSWITVHRSHHSFEDTERDPHSPHFIPKWKLILGLFPKNAYKISLVSDLIRSPNKKYFQYENQYYWLIWSSIWLVSYMISIWFFYFIVSGCALWYLDTQLVNIVGHSKQGKKSYNNAVAINSPVLNLITGAGHHNNHHANPKNYSYAVNGELDVYAWVIKHFFKT